MSKKYKGLTCVYCTSAPSTSADHVFAREFFLPEDRANLPQVPACDDCNRAKSRIEHCLATVLPFGGRHTGAKRNLQTLVPKRLARNAKLRRSLAAGWGSMWTREHGLHVPAATLPIQPDHIEKLLAFIARGLLWFHWKTLLRPADSIDVTALTRAGEVFFEEHIFNLAAANRICVDLGNGTVVYEGVQAADPPQISAWRISMYGGLTFGDPKVPGETAATIGILTGRIVSIPE